MKILLSILFLFVISPAHAASDKEKMEVHCWMVSYNFQYKNGDSGMGVFTTAEFGRLMEFSEIGRLVEKAIFMKNGKYADSVIPMSVSEIACK